MPIKLIKLSSDRDEQYRKLYRYFVRCEKSQELIRIKVIKTILSRTETRVRERIRRHWNEFIKEHPYKHEYIVSGLKDNCPEKYFVLAHQHRQAEHFYVFRTAIERHNRHIKNYRLAKQRKEEGLQLTLSFEEPPEDHIPPNFDDEGREYPEEDPASEVQVDDDEVENVTESDEEEVEGDEEILEAMPVSPYEEIVQIAQVAENLRPSAYMEPNRAVPPIEPVIVPPVPIQPTNDPPRGTRKPPFRWKRKILPPILIAAAVVVVVIVVFKYMYR